MPDSSSQIFASLQGERSLPDHQFAGVDNKKITRLAD